MKLFLNADTVFADFSLNELLPSDFAMFNVATHMRTLILSRVNLTAMSQIEFSKLANLTYLDMSWNMLTRLTLSAHFFNLEYFDASFNRIEVVVADIFTVADRDIRPLKQLNLAYNRIKCVSAPSNSFLNYLRLDSLHLSHNQLEAVPHFYVDLPPSDVYPTVREFHLDHNRITYVDQFSIYTYTLEVLNLDANEIAWIQPDAFYHLKELKRLSMAANVLANLSANYFAYLFNLRHLNLSRNSVSSIEPDTFQSMNRLLFLDLSFNSLVLLEDNVFRGLASLSDLHLFSLGRELVFSNRTFNYLSSLRSIYLNETSVMLNKCVFMHRMVRPVMRNIANKFVFYRSLNLVTSYVRLVNQTTTKAECEFTFNFLQLKIHFNLKRDEDNEIFYQDCRHLLLLSDSYLYANNVKMCFARESNYARFAKYAGANDAMSDESFYRVISNAFYLLTMLSILVFGSTICLIIFKSTV